jgi:hypothetical protein
METALDRLHTMRRTTAGGVLNAWRARVEATWGPGSRLDSIDAVMPILDSALRGSTSVSEALTALGHRAGFDGHPILEVADWVAALAELAPRRLRPALKAHRSAYLLADAWAAGRLARGSGDSDQRIDQLELRLGELYERCDALGLSVDREVALAVVAIHGLPACDDTKRRVFSEAVAAAHRIFTAGESVVVLESGRVLVLAERQPALPVKARHLALALESSLDLDGLQIRHWIEPLPPARMHLAAHLRLLAAA